MAKGKLKRRESKGKGGDIKRPSAPRVSTDDDTPHFCLAHLQRRYCVTDCTQDHQVAFILQLHRLSQQTWGEIKKNGRHAMGTEKISQNSIKAPIPQHVTPDTDLVALRFQGKKAFVGYRVDRVFHVLWIDRNHDLYT